jgi:hypothetical protein
MKTKSLFLLLIVLSVWSCKPTHLDRDGLKGDVKKVTTTVYSAEESKGEVHKGDFMWCKFVEYNEDGYGFEEGSYDESGELGRKTQYEYKDKNIVTAIYEYNSKGRKEVKYETIYQDDKPVRVEFDGEEGSKKNEFEFDGNKLISAKIYDEDGEYEGTVTFKYNDDDLLIEEISKSDHSTSTFEWKYNDDGMLTEECHTNKSDDWNSKSTTTYEYDENNHLIKQVEKYTSNDGETTTAEYKYDYTKFDEEGNWTRRTVYVDNKATQIEERDIEYY